MIDFHCHLDLYPNPHEIAKRCEELGIYLLSVTTTPSAWEGSTALERGRIRTALGLHPQLAAERNSELDLFDGIVGKTRFVGEIGLDGAPEFKNSWKAQVRVLNHILSSCSKAGGRILSIHSRRAVQPLLEQLNRNLGAGYPVLHWFTGTKNELDLANRLDCWFSVGPPMIYSKKSRELVSRLPRNRVLTESDGPFAQLQGRPVYPWDTDHVVYGLSKLWRNDVAQVRSLLRDNLRTLTVSLYGDTLAK